MSNGGGLGGARPPPRIDGMVSLKASIRWCGKRNLPFKMAAGWQRFWPRLDNLCGGMDIRQSYSKFPYFLGRWTISHIEPHRRICVVFSSAVGRWETSTYPGIVTHAKAVDSHSCGEFTDLFVYPAINYALFALTENVLATSGHFRSQNDARGSVFPCNCCLPNPC